MLLALPVSPWEKIDITVEELGSGLGSGTHLVECLPSLQEALGLNPSAAFNKAL